MCPYSSESDVYDAIGLDTTIVQSLSGKTSAQVTTLINSYVTRADARINGLLGIPVSVRKEKHTFDCNPTEELGPSEDDFEMFSNDDPNHLVTTIKKCGTASIKAIKASISTNTKLFSYTGNLHKRIGPWGFVGFWLYSSDATATFTLKIYDNSGNYDSITFTVPYANTWCLVQLNMTSFTSSSGDIDWTNAYMENFEIDSNKVVTVYFDNFNWNDGVFWTCPEGLVCWSNPDGDPDGIVYVTYAYNPYSSVVPEPIKEASAKLAGVELLNYLMGRRARTTAFEVESDTLEERPDRETLENTRNRIQREAEAALATIGFKAYEGTG